MSFAESPHKALRNFYQNYQRKTGDSNLSALKLG